ncbi:hypothetical protein QCA50_010874 [Cerrena zonata]|uniref:F-box domain-containing protein n=1 Tax=Cerrena zonata TaxID=2478898 RepID=A0AAW0G0Z8_9APHY
MPRSRSHSTSSVPSNLQSSWSLHSQPVISVYNQAEETTDLSSFTMETGPFRREPYLLDNPLLPDNPPHYPSLYDLYGDFYDETFSTFGGRETVIFDRSQDQNVEKLGVSNYDVTPIPSAGPLKPCIPIPDLPLLPGTSSVSDTSGLSLMQDHITGLYKNLASALSTQPGLSIVELLNRCPLQDTQTCHSSITNPIHPQVYENINSQTSLASPSSHVSLSNKASSSHCYSLSSQASSSACFSPVGSDEDASSNTSQLLELPESCSSSISDQTDVSSIQSSELDPSEEEEDFLFWDSLFQCLLSEHVIKRKFWVGCLPNEIYLMIICWLASDEYSYHNNHSRPFYKCALVCSGWLKIVRKIQSQSPIYFVRQPLSLFKQSFSNGCLPNELYHAIIAWVACFQQSPHKHLGICAQVCHIWSNIARKHQNANIILDHDNLSNYIRFIHQNPHVCRLVQSIDHQKPFTDDASYSIATQIILLIHRLPNIQKLTLCIRQWNNIHPDILKYAINNKTVNSLDITSGYHDKKHPLHWLWQFFACFHSLKTLSLDLYASSFVMNTYSLEYLYQKKLKASLRSLKIYIYTLNHTMLLDSLIQAGAFTSNLKSLHIITYINSATTQTELEQLSSAIQALLMHCSNHLQEFMHSDNHIPISLNLLSSKISLESCSNLTQFKYITEDDITTEHMLNLLQSISSPNVTNIFITFEKRGSQQSAYINEQLWNRIDTLLTTPQFKSLHMVTITQKKMLPLYLTFQTNLLPKLHKCGILAVYNWT